MKLLRKKVITIFCRGRASAFLVPAIARKIIGGNRSIEGAHIHEINLSVIETLKREFQNIFPPMKQLVLNYITSNG